MSLKHFSLVASMARHSATCVVTGTIVLLLAALTCQPVRAAPTDACTVCECRQGNSVVDCAERNLTSFNLALPLFAQKLYLDHNMLTEFPTIQHPWLIDLQLSHNPLTSLPADGLKGLPRLEQLNVCNTAIHTVHRTFFSGAALTDVSMCQVPELASVPASVVDDWTGLTRLDVSCILLDNKLKDFPINQLGRLTRLRSLYVSGCAQLAADIDALSSDDVKLLTSLTYLNIAGIRLPHIPRFVGSLAALTGLAYTVNGMTELSKRTVPRMPLLQQLLLSFNLIDRVDRDVFELLPSLTDLQMQTQPSQCHVVSPRQQGELKPTVSCRCAQGFSGTDFCLPIGEQCPETLPGFPNTICDDRHKNGVCQPSCDIPRHRRREAAVGSTEASAASSSATADQGQGDKSTTATNAPLTTPTEEPQDSPGDAFICTEDQLWMPQDNSSSLPPRQCLSTICQEVCECDNDGRIDCSKRGLHQVPGGLPRELSLLWLPDNPITQLVRGTFVNAGNLQSLDLSSCDISSIEEGAFMGADQLGYLDLSINNLKSYPPLQGIQTILRLSLIRNDIQVRPSTMEIVPVFRDAFERMDVGMCALVPQGTSFPLPFLDSSKNPVSCRFELYREPRDFKRRLTICSVRLACDGDSEGEAAGMQCDLKGSFPCGQNAQPGSDGPAPVSVSLCDVCDGKPDCSDGSDELACQVTLVLTGNDRRRDVSQATCVENLLSGQIIVETPSTQLQLHTPNLMDMVAVSVKAGIAWIDGRPVAPLKRSGNVLVIEGEAGTALTLKLFVPYSGEPTPSPLKATVQTLVGACDIDLVPQSGSFLLYTYEPPKGGTTPALTTSEGSAGGSGSSQEPATSQPSPPARKGKHGDAGAIAGAVVAVMLALAAALFVAFLIFRRRRQSHNLFDDSIELREKLLSVDSPSNSSFNASMMSSLSSSSRRQNDTATLLRNTDLTWQALGCAVPFEEVAAAVKSCTYTDVPTSEKFVPSDSTGNNDAQSNTLNVVHFLSGGFGAYRQPLDSRQSSPLVPALKIGVKMNPNSSDNELAVAQALLVAGHHLAILSSIRPHPGICSLLSLHVFSEGVDLVFALPGPCETLHTHFSRLKRGLSSNGISYTKTDLVSAAQQLAAALSHMESLGMIHGSISAQSVLVYDTLQNCKFVLPGYMPPRTAATMTRDETRWLAPEQIDDDLCFTTEADVWAFGILMWYLITRGRAPYGSLSVQEIQADIAQGRHPPIPPADNGTGIGDLLRRCWHLEPDKRLSFKSVFSMLLTWQRPSPAQSSAWLHIQASSGANIMKGVDLGPKAASILQRLQHHAGASTPAALTTSTVVQHSNTSFYAVALPASEVSTSFLRVMGEPHVISCSGTVEPEVLNVDPQSSVLLFQKSLVDSCELLTEVIGQQEQHAIPLCLQAAAALDFLWSQKAIVPDRLDTTSFMVLSSATGLRCILLPSTFKPVTGALHSDEARIVGLFGRLLEACAQSSQTLASAPGLAQLIQRCQATGDEPAFDTTTACCIAAESVLSRRRGLVEVSPADLAMVRHLGSGEFGDVNLMMLIKRARTGMYRQDDADANEEVARYGFSDSPFLDLVAVKTLRDEKYRDDFFKEVRLMRRLHHPNLVRLRGIVQDHLHPAMLLEYLPYGSLESWLQDRCASEMAPGTELVYTLWFVAHQVACGMAEMERLNLVHRDLAARNVLVGPCMQIKVSDFGLSRELTAIQPRANSDDSAYYRLRTSRPLPVRWMAPETLSTLKCTSSSDVWSYGCLLYELFTLGKMPFAEIDDVSVVQKLIELGRAQPQQGESNAYVADHLRVLFGGRLAQDLLLRCVVAAPSARPAFHELAQQSFQLMSSQGTTQRV